MNACLSAVLNSVSVSLSYLFGVLLRFSSLPRADNTRASPAYVSLPISAVRSFSYHVLSFSVGSVKDDSPTTSDVDFINDTGVVSDHSHIEPNADTTGGVDLESGSDSEMVTEDDNHRIVVDDVDSEDSDARVQMVSPKVSGLHLCGQRISYITYAIVL